MRRIITAAVAAAVAVAGSTVLDVAAPAAAATSVTNPQVAVSPATAAVAAGYTVTFLTSSSGALTPGAGSITLTAPSGTAFPSSASDYTVNNSAATSVSGGGTDSVTVTVPATASGTGSSSQITLVASSVTNPSVASTGNTIAVSTSADTAPVPTNSYSITPALTAVREPTATASPDIAGRSATYTVGFTTSPTGALAADGTIRLVAPAGTVFSASSSSVTVDGVAAAAVTIANNGATLAVTAPAALGAGQAVVVRASGVINPAASASGGDTLAVSTTADAAPAATSAYTISSAAAPDTNVSNVSEQLSTNLDGATGASYTTAFTTSSAGALTGGVPGLTGATITLAAPAGTAFPATASDYTINGTAPANASPAAGGATVTLALAPGASIGDSSPVTVVATGVTNPQPTGEDTLAVRTSADTDPVASTLYTIAAAPTSVAGVSVTVNPNAAGATAATYTVGFDTSPTGALAAGSGTITLTAPAGTSWSNTPSDYTVNATPVTTVSAGAGTAAHIVTITVPAAVPAGSAVSVAGTAVNPAAATGDTLAVTTSADTVPASSSPYAISTPATPQVSQTSTQLAAATATESGTYTVGFTTSATGALGGLNSSGPATITLAAPAGTAWPSNAGDYTVNTTPVASVTTADRGATVTITLAPTQSIPDSSPVTVVADPTVNPASPGSDTIAVSTSADTNPVSTPDYTITPVPSVTSVSPASGPPGGGTSVTITGAGLANPTAVDFGNVSAEFTSVGPDQIAAVSPASQPGVVDVTVTANGLTSKPGPADLFTYGSGTASGYVGLATPQRLFDSRPGESDAPQGGRGPLLPGSVYPVKVAGQAGLPASGITAVAVTVTAVGPAGDGNLRVYPDSNGAGTTSAPMISTINYIPNQTVPNFDVVNVPTDGTIDLATYGSATNALVDVTGYFTTGAGYTALSPTRLLDTRTSGGAAGVTANTVYSLAVPTTVVPAGATAVAINVGTITPTAGGNLRVYPDTNGAGTTTAPGTSTVNYVPGASIDNFDIVALPTDRRIDYESFGANTNITIDVVGYVTAGVATQTPQRLLDTRTSNGSANVIPGPVYSVVVAGRDGVPGGARAVLVNVTVAVPQGVGNLRVYPDSQGNGQTSPPATSTVNYLPNQAEAIFAIVALPTDGQVDYATFGSATNVIFDVSGSL